MTATEKRKRQRARKANPNRPVSVEEREMATEVMNVVFNLARSAFRARARLLSEGYQVEDIPHEESVRALLGITEQQQIVVPPTPEIKPVKTSLIKRLLS